MDLITTVCQKVAQLQALSLPWQMLQCPDKHQWSNSVTASMAVPELECHQEETYTCLFLHAQCCGLPPHASSSHYSTNSVRHYGEQRESRRKNDGEHAPIKTVARKNIVRKMSQIYADMTTAPFRILHGGKILN